MGEAALRCSHEELLVYLAPFFTTAQDDGIVTRAVTQGPLFDVRYGVHAHYACIPAPAGARA
eukprot:scaffold19271_cov28-Tisochrysis_lutea.AAC.16